jgi:hypothetical protein
MQALQALQMRISGRRRYEEPRGSSWLCMWGMHPLAHPGVNTHRAAGAKTYGIEGRAF